MGGTGTRGIGVESVSWTPYQNTAPVLCLRTGVLLHRCLVRRCDPPRCWLSSTWCRRAPSLSRLRWLHHPPCLHRLPTPPIPQSHLHRLTNPRPAETGLRRVYRDSTCGARWRIVWGSAIAAVCRRPVRRKRGSGGYVRIRRERGSGGRGRIWSCWLLVLGWHRQRGIDGGWRSAGPLMYPTSCLMRKFPKKAHKRVYIC